MRARSGEVVATLQSGVDADGAPREIDRQGRILYPKRKNREAGLHNGRRSM